MSVWVVVGGQFGSEGKGKLTSFLALHDDASVVVRCGGPNAGHTVDYRGRRHVLRQIPAGFINPRSRLLLAPGSVIDFDQLSKEAEELGLAARIGVDPNAVVVSSCDREQEGALKLRKTIASTLSGTGVATSRKVLREQNLRLAGREGSLSHWLTDVPCEVNRAHDAGGLVIVEGTQGFGLSLHHGDLYPYRTSRDTTAASFLGEAGLSPLTVTGIVLVVRTFPIRVGGHSGPLPNEISWQEVQQSSMYPRPVEEFTSVTGTLRRVAQFDMALVKRAAMINRPTDLAVHGLDYLNYQDFGKTDYEDLSNISKAFVCRLEETVGVPATFLFTGPPNECLIDRRSYTKPKLSHERVSESSKLRTSEMETANL